ncbi:MAG: hypothetical protein Q7J47_22955 [Azoarcus sp.]|nr:hypothetical protein [Azoarcus sp.]
MIPATKGNARPLERADRAQSSEVSTIHATKIAQFPCVFDGSLARSQENGTRWLPNPNSCAGQLLLALIENEVSGGEHGITPKMFHREVWSQRLAAYVLRLRQGGWTISTALCAASNRFEKVQHAAYRLELDVDLEQLELAQWVIVAREVSR